ncbi:hypothetical protein HN358_00575 [Candidatus Uhrbacteria bacterium]|jgi:hypothetical protein|nr:hypothetical protein [Candidatus Uhrbacteria bacterium]MBT7717379.1 hypothetical protein [Candidatus Uhrbacteria bacterium]
MKYSKFITFDALLISLVVVIATSLLVWNRIDTEPHMTATNIETGEIIERGEIMTTTDEHSAFEVNDSIVYLSKNTELKLVDGREGQIDLQLIQGRIVLEDNLNISIREVDISTTGQTSVVHYSWLDEIEVATINSTTLIEFDDQTLELENEAINLQTLDPYIVQYIELDAGNSSEADFYEWVSSFTQQ